MGDKEPPMKITYGEGQEIIASPENTVLYTFAMGNLALGAMNINRPDVNHVYIKTGDDTENTTKGMYLFEKYHGDLYEMIKDYVQRNDFPQILNMTGIPECDIRAYLNYKEVFDQKAIDEFTEELPDFLPEDFK